MCQQSMHKATLDDVPLQNSNFLLEEEGMSGIIFALLFLAHVAAQPIPG